MTLVLLALILLVAVLSLALTARRMSGQPGSRMATLLGLRALAWCLLAGALVGPLREVSREAPLPVRIALVLDGSRSMSLPESAGRTRLSVAQAAANVAAQALGRAPCATEVRWYRFATDLAAIAGPRDVRATGQSTDLRAAVAGLCFEGGLEAALLLSDGDDTEGNRAESLAAMARTAGLKIGAVTLGADYRPVDIAVDRVTVPRQVRAGAWFELTASVRTQGVVGQDLQAEIRRDRTVVRSLRVTARAVAQVLSVKLQAGTPGRYRYTLSVQARPGELSAANNSRSALVQVTPDKPGVLLIAGRPSPEYAALKRILLADRELRVRCYVRKALQRGFWRDEARPSPGVPKSDDLAHTKAVLLQDVPAGALGGFTARLADFVRGGGSLAALGGPDSLPVTGELAALLPVRSGAGAFVDELVRPRVGDGNDPLTRALRGSDIPFGALPSWRGRNVVGGARPGAQVPLTATNAPLMACWDIGRGRTLVLATGGTSRWALDPDAGEKGRKALEAFWGILVDWLTQVRDDRPVVAQFERDTLDAGTPARLLVQVTDESLQPVMGATVAAEVQSSGQTFRLPCAPAPDAPGRYETSVPTDAPGALKAKVTATYRGKKLGADVAEATVLEAMKELAGAPRPELLRAICEGTGGAVTGPEGAAELAMRLLPPSRTIRRAEEFSPARGAWALALLVVLWGLDWGLRRRWMGP